MTAAHPTPRVALYARYSSDNQRDASIDDQLRQCRERAAREGWTVVETYSDRAISGASLIRSGIQSLLADAQAGRFDIVLSEALDRISRDQEDVAGVFKRLRFAGVTISCNRVSSRRRTVAWMVVACVAMGCGQSSGSCTAAISLCARSKANSHRPRR